MTPQPVQAPAAKPRKPSELQLEFAAFFRDRLNSYGATSPANLNKLQRSEFFTGIKREWAKIKETKNLIKRSEQTITPGIPIARSTARREPEIHNRAKSILPPGISDHEKIERQIIISEPNPAQSDDLRILYNPNNHFLQQRPYKYPVVKFPNPGSRLKLPRQGRSNQKGYKEADFLTRIQTLLPRNTGLEISDKVHLVIPHFNKPYEPDILLFDTNLNLYIDIEIDEPYDGYYRFPTHNTVLDQFKKDDIRDQFFNDSGWIVLRFTEKQVHLQPQECVDYVESIIHSIYGRTFSTKYKVEAEDQWDDDQSIHWQKTRYREKYLDISHFNKQRFFQEVRVDVNEQEPIEGLITRESLFPAADVEDEIAFHEQTHKYLHPRDQTGNAEFISATTLIGRFFPFEITRYIEKKMVEEGRPEEELLFEYFEVRDQAGEQGTLMHSQIENYLLDQQTHSESPEFQLFLKFMHEQVVPRNLYFEAAEKRVVSHNFNVAGTIDCLLKKADKEEYIIVDWKRSKNLIIDGHPKKYGYGYALSELSHLDNSSYYKYCLQQNIYKYILESEYGLKVSSMKLVVLHERYPSYYVVDVPVMTKESEIILTSLKHKI